MAQDPLTTAVSVPERLPGHTHLVRPHVAAAARSCMRGRPDRLPGNAGAGALPRTVFHLWRPGGL